MTFIVRVLMEEANGNKVVVSDKNVHVDGQFEFDNLEKAREAAEVACHAAANLKPRRWKEVDDDDWKFHPDRTDD
jgi:rRNA processing protein Krr1/Pno1